MPTRKSAAARKRASRKPAGGKAAPAKKATAPARPRRKPAAAPIERVVRGRRKQPETLRLRAVSPGFTVNDIGRSVAWYRDVLGFVAADEWRREGKLLGATVKAGAVELFLGQDDWKKGRDRRKGEGFRIYCSTAQDVDAVAARIKAAGGVLTHEPRDEPWGERDFGIVDPDGFKITISKSA